MRRARPRQPGKRAVARKKPIKKFPLRFLQRRGTAKVVTLEVAKQARMLPSETTKLLTHNSLAVSIS